MNNLGTNNIESSRPYWGGIGTLFFGILIAIVFLIVQGLVIGLFISLETMSYPEPNIDQLVEGLINNGFVLSIGSLSTTLVCIPLIFLIITIKRGLSIKEYLHINPIPLKTLLSWMGIIAVFLVCYDVITNLINRPLAPEFMTTAYKTAKFLPLFWFVLIVLAPLSEEFFFRGFLFKGFQSTFLKSTGTILITSALWASIHLQYDFYDITFVFIIGILLGLARLKTESVLATTYLHGFMNLVATIETAIVVS